MLTTRVLVTVLLTCVDAAVLPKVEDRTPPALVAAHTLVPSETTLRMLPLVASLSRVEVSIVPLRLMRAMTRLFAKPLGAAVATAALYPPSVKNWPVVEAVKKPSEVELPVSVKASWAFAAVTGRGSC